MLEGGGGEFYCDILDLGDLEKR